VVGSETHMCNAMECIFAVEGHEQGQPRSLILVPIESAYMISY